jgi:uncharacterized protein YkwD
MPQLVVFIAPFWGMAAGPRSLQCINGGHVFRSIRGMTLSNRVRGGVLLAGAVAAWAAVSAPRMPDLATAAGVVVEQANRFRASQGRRAVKPSDRLRQAASDFAAYMASTDRYGHEADGRTPVDRVRATGYDDCLVAENIAFQFNSGGFGTEALAEDFEQGWEHSPPHRANLVDPDATEIGVAIARSPRSGRFYAVQVLGRPRSASLRFKVANAAGQPLAYEVDGERFSLPPRTTMTHEVCRPPALAYSLPGGHSGNLKPVDGEVVRFVADRAGRVTVQPGQP